MSITATVSDRDIRAIDDMIGRVAVATQRSTSSVIVTATIYAAQSAAKATPISAYKTRKVTQLGMIGGMGQRARAKREAGGIPWWARWSVRIWRRGLSGDVFVRTKSALEKIRKVPRRGIARKSWTRALRAISASAGVGADGAPADGSDLSLSRAGGNITSTRYTNKIRYAGKIAPNSAQIGVSKATSRLEKVYLRQISRDAGRMWR